MLDHPSLAAPLPNGLIAVNDDYNHRVVLDRPGHEQHRLAVRPHRRGRHRSGQLNTPDGIDLLLPGGVIPLHVDFASPKVHAGRP